MAITSNILLNDWYMCNFSVTWLLDILLFLHCPVLCVLSELLFLLSVNKKGRKKLFSFFNFTRIFTEKINTELFFIDRFVIMMHK